MSYPDWNLTIGAVVAPFSRFGEVKVRIETDFPERFEGLETVCIRALDGTGKLMKVERTRLHKGQILLLLHGISSINLAEEIRGSLVQVRQGDAVSLPDNEYYVHDLVGCTVFLDSGKELGRLNSVMRGTANDVYVIGQGKEEILLPAVRQVVISVDIIERKIVVSLIPGLLPGEAETA
ncbi:ribosome maturation factor RimM [Armatimonadota bacterium]|nr:ribosome maturation factor RimM [Armatimonadota bacterium]GDX40187.1 ribosome maturation factor RimM [Armatimonadota bacterium]